MLRKLLKNRKAQNTAEYAILISLVVAGIIAMQTYAQRALQGRVRGAAGYMTNAIHSEDPKFGSTKQYEPYYLATDYEIKRSEKTTKKLGEKTASLSTNATRTRISGGNQISSYNGTTTF